MWFDAKVPGTPLKEMWERFLLFEEKAGSKLEDGGGPCRHPERSSLAVSSTPASFITGNLNTFGKETCWAVCPTSPPSLMLLGFTSHRQCDTASLIPRHSILRWSVPCPVWELLLRRPVIHLDYSHLCLCAHILRSSIWVPWEIYSHCCVLCSSESWDMEWFHLWQAREINLLASWYWKSMILFQA